ncbi:TlyA family RNA methyltransferase [Sulfurospirillum sp. T05]|uniref:TlyA family RNA methyltransferase n=1 Tax=Sulfurospirillum tamanense TaxID=2813362 RepID=A0ABS2WQA3_9BACT|nr:TlyA family RNA methyltransferase [Sulfurospirillum tamanensis]MBN2963778.1 TlyA family RNA methyltransferase [Sulfurospirillum tamanensis]
MRLDAYLAEKGLAQSRNKAQEIISEGFVLVNGESVQKHAFEVGEKDTVKVLEHARYVSRAGEKLAKFLEDFPLEIAGKRCLDVGSSTGGFTQVLLENNALHVSAVDVGKDQLHVSLRAHENLVVHEETNITEFSSPTPFEVVTCDVSFVGVEALMPSIDALACGMIVVLFKPQFEVGKEAKRSKKGVLKDGVAIMQARRRFEIAAAGFGWELCYVEESKLKGKEGNVEFFYAFKKR